MRDAAECRDGAAPCEKTISEGVFEQGLHAEVHGTRAAVMSSEVHAAGCIIDGG